MNSTQKILGSIAVTGFACFEASLLATVVYANPTVIVPTQSIVVPTRPVYLSQTMPLEISYDCGTVGFVTLKQEPNTNGERYTYIGMNNKGQTLTVTNGVGYGDASSTIYTFVAKDDSRFVIEDFRNGKATLTTGRNATDVKSTTFNCTVSNSQASGSSQSSQSSSSEQIRTQTTIIRTTTTAKPVIQKQSVTKQQSTPTNAVRALW